VKPPSRNTHGRPACAPCDKREKGAGCSDHGSARQRWARGLMHRRCASLPTTCAMRLKHMCWGKKAGLERSSCWRQILKSDLFTVGLVELRKRSISRCT
jgi:hypothetical protein